MKKLARTITDRCNEAMIPDEITYGIANEASVVYTQAKDELARINGLVSEYAKECANSRESGNWSKPMKMLSDIDSALKALKSKVKKIPDSEFSKDDKNIIASIGRKLLKGKAISNAKAEHGTTSSAKADIITQIDFMIQAMAYEKSEIQKMNKK